MQVKTAGFFAGGFVLECVFFFIICVLVLKFFAVKLRFHPLFQQEIALFVAKRLAPLDSVTSTTTTFVLKKYKEDGVILSSQSDERGADVI